LDDFDILPTLKKIKTSKKIIWISHKEYNLEKAEIEVIEEVNRNSTNKNKNSKTDRLGKELLSFCTLDPNKKTQIFRIKVDTSKILTWFYYRYVDSSIPEVSQNECLDFDFPRSMVTQVFDKWFLAAQIFRRRNFIEKSIRSYNRALCLAEQKGNLRIIAECYNNLGLIHKNQGKMRQALDYYYKALEIDETPNYGKASMINNIGSIYKAQGNFKEAIKYYKRALAVLNKHGNINEKATTLNNIGTILLAQEKSDEALTYFETSLNIARTQGNLYSISTTLGNIGTFYRNRNRNRNDLDLALEYYTEAYNVADQLGSLREKATRLNNISSILVSQSKLDQALENYKKNLVIDEQLGDIEKKATTLNNIASIYQRKGERKPALKLLFQALEIDEQLDNLEFQKKSHHQRIYTIYHK